MVSHIHGTSITPLPNNIRAVVFDVDGTIKDEEPIAAHVGKRLIMNQFYRCHPIGFLKGYFGSREVKKIVKENGIENQAYGLKKFFEIVGKTIKVDLRTLDKLTKDILKEKELSGFSAFNEELQKRGVDTFFSTVSYDRVGRVGLDIYSLKGYAANQTIWQNPSGNKIKGDEIVYRGSGKIDVPSIQGDVILKDCSLTIITSEGKRRATEELMKSVGIRKEDVAIVGNDRLDHASMKYFGLAIAPPLADKETEDLVQERHENGRFIQDYNVAIECLLRDFQPRKK